jgi:glutamine amidotransferase
MFMHNGQVGCYGQLRRRIENLIPDAAYAHRSGTTDSEAIFLIALARLERGMDMVRAFESTLADIKAMMSSDQVCEALRFTAVVTDGRDLHAFRWACDAKAPTLYWRDDAGRLLVVSEPLDDVRDTWRPVPQGHALVAREGRPVEIRPFLAELAQAA